MFFCLFFLLGGGGGGGGGGAFFPLTSTQQRRVDEGHGRVFATWPRLSPYFRLGRVGLEVGPAPIELWPRTFELRYRAVSLVCEPDAEVPAKLAQKRLGPREPEIQSGES